jgi:hypothetical protein
VIESAPLVSPEGKIEITHMNIKVNEPVLAKYETRHIYKRSGAEVRHSGLTRDEAIGANLNIGNFNVCRWLVNGKFESMVTKDSHI